MEQYVIKGGQPLEGEVTIAGAKMRHSVFLLLLL